MIVILFFSLLLLTTPMAAIDDTPYFETNARSGDGVLTLLGRYHLVEEACNLEEFYRLNEMNADDYLLEGKAYKLPVLIFKYNSKSIRSTVGISDYDQAVRIQKYNERLVNEQLRESDYRTSKVLWVPFHELNCQGAASVKPSNKKSYQLPILGPKEADVIVKSDDLQGQVYYVISGHGGPDPGAVSKSGRSILCEDEYAYDVSLRLFKLLLEQGAKAYLIIEDQNDGIRDHEILPCDQDERCRGAEIPLNQGETTPSTGRRSK
ncbi:MAG: N-acetylmuramoyl-L-alanine amidase [Saprospiraceae bacterium]|nr:N-acetylmuramoyl-L-alanine amidase [Saprospiraceae bacterium]